jgi:hypothetical protein
MRKIILPLFLCIFLASCNSKESGQVDALRKRLIEEANWAEPIRFIDTEIYGIFTSSKGVFIFHKDVESVLTILVEDLDKSSRFHVDGNSSALTYWLDSRGSYEKLLVHDSDKGIIMFDANGDGVLEKGED